MLWAALWLHRATGRAEYLDYAVAMADEFGGTSWAIAEFSWDVKYAGLAAKVHATVMIDHRQQGICYDRAPRTS